MSTHKNGLVSVYNFGFILGCVAGGLLVHNTSRINALSTGFLFTVVGSSLQAEFRFYASCHGGDGYWDRR